MKEKFFDQNYSTFKTDQNQPRPYHPHYSVSQTSSFQSQQPYNANPTKYVEKQHQKLFNQQRPPFEPQSFLEYSTMQNANVTQPMWYTQSNTHETVNKHSDYARQHKHITSPFDYSITNSPKKELNTNTGYLLGMIGQKTNNSVNGETTKLSNDGEIDELPLLEELGIYPDQILKRMRSALLFYKIDKNLLLDIDMYGPLFIAACLGGCLLLAGKVHFGYIYGLSVTGCIGMCLLLNLMTQNYSIHIYKTTSILGYGLLPVVGLAAISIFFCLRNLTGTILSALTVIWCTATASRFFETALDMTHQRFLVAYPILLLYGCFVLITVF